MAISFPIRILTCLHKPAGIIHWRRGKIEGGFATNAKSNVQNPPGHVNTCCRGQESPRLCGTVWSMAMFTATRIVAILNWIKPIHTLLLHYFKFILILSQKHTHTHTHNKKK